MSCWASAASACCKSDQTLQLSDSDTRPCLIDGARIPIYHVCMQTQREIIMSDLNNASPKRPEDAKTHAESKAEQQSKQPAPSEATQGNATKNDSTVAPEKSKNEALRGFHGG